MAAEGTVAILVVDDDEAMRMLCRINLELEGYRVLEADGLDQAIRLLQEEAIALALLDLKLERGGEGAVIARRIRAEWPDTSIILMSGTVPLPEDATPLADGTLEKPFDLEELVGKVKHLVPLAAD